MCGYYFNRSPYLVVVSWEKDIQTLMKTYKGLVAMVMCMCMYMCACSCACVCPCMRLYMHTCHVIIFY